MDPKSRYIRTCSLGAVGFAAGDHGYVCTGTDGTANYNDLEEYDPSSNSWTTKAPFPATARREGAAFSINGIGYVGFGRTSPQGQYFNDLWAYDPQSNSWTAKASCPSGGLASPGVFVLNGKGYVLGGRTEAATYSNQLWEYDPSNNSWGQKSGLPGAGRSGPIAFSVIGKGYVGSGNDNSSDQCSSDFWQWDPTTNVWTQKADIPGPARRTGAAFVVNNIPYAGSGWNGSTYLTDMYRFDVTNNMWTAIANYGGAGAYTPIAFAINDKGYLGSGSTSSGASPQFWEYNTVLVGIATHGAAVSIVPDLVGDEIVLTGWTNTQADAYFLMDATGRRITGGTLKTNEIAVPRSMSEGVYLRELIKGNSIQLSWRFAKAS